MKRLARAAGRASVGIVENVPLNEGTGDRAVPHRRSERATRRRRLPGLHLHGGRLLQDDGHRAARGPAVRDRTTSSRICETSSSAARRRTCCGRARIPIGRRVQREGLDAWETVVGVVEDVMQNNFRDPPQAAGLFPARRARAAELVISSPAYVVKTARAETIAPEVRALVREVAPDAPMYRVYTMAGLAKRSMVQLSFTMLTLGVVSVLALILGAVGLYGVLSYVVAQRTREIGVRMALGAEASRVRRMVVAQGARVVAIGVVDRGRRRVRIDAGAR